MVSVALDVGEHLAMSLSFIQEKEVGTPFGESELDEGGYEFS